MIERPALRPGAAVLRRDARHLQIGTSPGTVVADHPGLLALLLHLDGVRDVATLQALVPDLPVDATLTELAALGVVVDGASWDCRHRDEARALATAGDALALQRRHRLTVSLHSDGGAQTLRSRVESVLHEAGVVPHDASDPDLLVLITSGEPTRETLRLARERGQAHLVVRLDEDRVLVGPLVVPGRTPCVECADLHRADWDPAWRVLVPQLGRRAVQHNPPAPGALLTQTAAVEVAAVVLAAADHRPLPLLGEVLALGPAHDERDRWPVRFHHRCLCAALPILER